MIIIATRVYQVETCYMMNFCIVKHVVVNVYIKYLGCMWTLEARSNAIVLGELFAYHTKPLVSVKKIFHIYCSFLWT